MMVNWKFAWREARQRPSRSILTLLSIVIGVAAVVSVTIASGTTRQAFNQIYETVAGKASLVISGALGSSFDETIAEKVRSLPGVAEVAPLIKRNTILYVGKKKQYRLVALGIDPKYDQKVRDYEIVAGKRLRRLEKPPANADKKFQYPPPSPGEGDGILLEEEFAHNAGVELDQRLEMLTHLTQNPKANVVGFYKSRGAASMAEGAPILMPILAAQQLFRTYKKIDSAQIVLMPDADEEAVKQEISKMLPPGVSVHPPESRSPIADETSKSTQQGMNMARAFSLVVAVFIIANSFLINVTQRRKQLGIMRAIGATRRQIGGMVFREAFLMGILGTLIGSVLGVLAAHFLVQAMGSLYQATLPSVDLTQAPFLIGTWRNISSFPTAVMLIIQDPFVLGMICGLGVSVFAAALPSWKASHLSPLEAMRDVLAQELEGTSKWLVRSGAFLAAAGLSVMAASIAGWIPMFCAIFGAVFMLIGLVLMLPLALGQLSALVTRAMRGVALVESRLARLQLLRHHSRTTLTVGVVFMAIAMGICLAISIMDTVQDVRNWYEKAYRADFYVRAESPSMATGEAAALPDNVGSDIRKIDGIKSVDAIRYRPLTAAGELAHLVARDHSSPDVPDFDVKSGDVNTLREQLKKGEVAIGSVLAERAKLNVGDQIELESASGPQKFPVAAIVNDYQNGGLTIHMEREVARKRLGLEGIDAYAIKADPKHLDSVRKAVAEITARYGLMLRTFTDIRQEIDVRMSGVVASLWSMVVMLLLVSAVGVTNTLTINVLEQTREIGLLRIVAMTCNQVRKTIFTQAMIMGVLALVPGIVAGVAVAYLINLSMLPVTGHAVDFTLHPWLLVGGFVLGMLVVCLAAWFPANRASQLDLPTALRVT
jgi:putative ABC transport system permease protein